VVATRSHSSSTPIWWSTKPGLEGEAHLAVYGQARRPILGLLPPPRLLEWPRSSLLAGILIADAKTGPAGSCSMTSAAWCREN